MTRTIMRSVVLLGLGLTLTACAAAQSRTGQLLQLPRRTRAGGQCDDHGLDHGGGSYAARHGVRFRDAGGGRLSPCGPGFLSRWSVLHWQAPPSGPASAQGVPTFDARLFAGRQAILEQTDQDLALQQDRLSQEEELAEIERQQLASLEGLMDAMSLGSGDVAGTVAGLEAGQGAVRGSAGDVESAAASLPMRPMTTTRPQRGMFGDAQEGIEELIIRAARHTYSLPGVSRAGLSLSAVALPAAGG